MTFGHPYDQGWNQEYHRLAVMIVVEHLNRCWQVCHSMEERILNLSFQKVYLHRCDPAQRCRAEKVYSTCYHLHPHLRSFQTEELVAVVAVIAAAAAGAAVAVGDAVIVVVAHSERESVTWAEPRHQRVVTERPFDKANCDTWGAD